MIVGAIKEVKDQENRVGLTPQGAKHLVKRGHTVLVEKNAGVGSGFSDAEYRAAGAKVITNKETIFKQVDLLVKVKEPQPSEYKYLKHLSGKVLFSYLHLVAIPKKVTQLFLKHNVTAIAYGTVEDTKGRLPLLIPMSQVAGVMAVQYATEFLQLKHGGCGVTLGDVQNTKPAHVSVLGSGTVGLSAARAALGLGAHVTAFCRRESSAKRAHTFIEKTLGKKLARNFSAVVATKTKLKKALSQSQVVVGAALVRGGTAPVIVDKDLIKYLPKGAVIVDVAIDQGGNVYGSKPTSHSKPVYVKNGLVYCCIPNMPGQAAHQATLALTTVTLPYVEKLARFGVENLVTQDAGFAKGVQVHNKKIRNKEVAKGLNLNSAYKSL